ncbi:MAG: MATE family efflux transporter [Marinifilaceae bacterium]|nr:MATE family efflux transporter [Marinifilaceae bacterium]
MFKRMKTSIPFSEYKKTLLLSTPVIIAQAGQIMVGLVDNIMIGQLGYVDLAAASFTNTLFQLVVIFGMGFSFAVTPVVGQRLVTKDYKFIGRALKNGIVSNLLMGIIMVLIMIGLSFCIPFMHQPASIILKSTNFMLLLTVSIIPMQIFYVFKQFYEGIGNTKISMIVMLTANIINIIGNYCFMYGKFGCPELGLYGAAVGTILSRIYMMILQYVFLARKISFRKFYIGFKDSRVTLEGIKNFFVLGMPLAGQMVMEASAFGVCTIMMGWIDDISLAAHQIGVSLSTVGFMVYQGIGAATTIRVSHVIGEDNYKKISTINTVSIRLSLVYCLLIVLFYVLGRNILPLAFTDKKEVIDLAALMLIMCASYQLSDGIQIVLAGVLRGFADVKKPAVITFISYFIISLPFSYLCAFPLGFGAVGLWFGFPVGLTIASILYYYRYRQLLKPYLE